ncbi:MAG: hypothetical protein ABI353_02840 [Isosphaeraceae bacterium]
MLSTATPDLAMLSASTLDSRSVSVSYDVKNASIGSPVEFAVYRSADNAFDPSDTKVGSIPVSPTLGLDGQPALAVGKHQLTIPLADGLPPDPHQPFVLVVANPGRQVAESNVSNNTASFRKHVVGVIVHGGLQPMDWDQGPPWERRMASALKDQGYDKVIAYNWVPQSRTPGMAVKQSPRLASMVVDAVNTFPANEPVDVHFISHSEGSVIAGQTILKLKSDAPPQMRAGFLKDTMIDPHSANNGTPGKQYSVSSGLLGKIAKATINTYQSKAGDPPVIVPDNVDDAEVFYQHTPVSMTYGSNKGVYNLWGQVPVIGEASYFNLTAPGLSHSGKFGMTDWYQINVVPTLGDGAPAIKAATLTGDLVNPDARTSRTSDTNRPVFAGSAAPGASVRIFTTRAGVDQLGRVGTTTADANGNWEITTRPIGNGHYRMLAMSDTPPLPGHLRSNFMRPMAWFGPLTIDAVQHSPRR